MKVLCINSDDLRLKIGVIYNCRETKERFNIVFGSMERSYYKYRFIKVSLRNYIQLL